MNFHAAIYLLLRYIACIFVIRVKRASIDRIACLQNKPYFLLLSRYAILSLHFQIYRGACNIHPVLLWLYTEMTIVEPRNDIYSYTYSISLCFVAVQFLTFYNPCSLLPQQFCVRKNGDPINCADHSLFFLLHIVAILLYPPSFNLTQTRTPNFSASKLSNSTMLVSFH